MFEFKTVMDVRIKPMVRDGKVVSIKTPYDIKNEVKDVADIGVEVFGIITLNAKNSMIGRHIITQGLVDASLVHPREIFRKALMDNACALVLFHNHPSGDTTPSAEDLRITRQLVDAGKILDVKVLDHAIIGKNDVTGEINHTSLREMGVCQF